jgi:hypothetical protein
MRREAAGSAGLHLFQELPTLAQQLPHPLLLGQGFGQNKAHASTAHAETAPGLRRCAARYWHGHGTTCGAPPDLALHPVLNPKGFLALFGKKVSPPILIKVDRRRYVFAFTLSVQALQLVHGAIERKQPPMIHRPSW